MSAGSSGTGQTGLEFIANAIKSLAPKAKSRAQQRQELAEKILLTLLKEGVGAPMLQPRQAVELADEFLDNLKTKALGHY